MAERFLSAKRWFNIFFIYLGARKILNMKRSVELLSGRCVIGAVFLVLCSLPTGLAFGQQPELTPEQMRLLEQVPANYRKQALDAIRRSQSAAIGAEGDDDSEATDQETLFRPEPREADEEEFEELRGSPNSRLIVDLALPIELDDELLEVIEDDPVLPEKSAR